MSEFHAMTKLLDDPDAIVYDHVGEKMVGYGEEVVPLLENVWRNSKDSLVLNRIEDIIERINFNVILDEFNIWKSLKNPDLIDAMAILNRLQYPNYNTKLLYTQLEESSKEIWLELNEELTGFEMMNVINKIIYEMWSFRSVHDREGDSFHYHFLSNLLEMKCGNQFSIGLFYLIIAEKVDLQVLPVLLEDQLILAYVREVKKMEEYTDEDVLFYLNPNEKGLIFDDLTIRTWIKKYELNDKPSYYLPVDNKRVIHTYINRLIKGYSESGLESKAQFLKVLSKSLN